MTESRGCCGCQAKYRPRSNPSGADATVAGTHLGRTPTEIDLPAGIAHQVVLSAPGYKNWIQAVFADPGRKLTLKVDEAELARRRAAWQPPKPHYTRGFGTLYLKHVTQANEGCDFDFLEGTAAVSEPEIH